MNGPYEEAGVWAQLRVGVSGGWNTPTYELELTSHVMENVTAVI